MIDKEIIEAGKFLYILDKETIKKWELTGQEFKKKKGLG